MNAAATDALQQGLQANTAFDAVYADGLSNHLPMVLHALHALGAPAARLQAFAAHYTQRLAPAPAAQAWPAGDAWAGRLGDSTAWAVYRDLFNQWLHHEAAGEVLEAVLPRLLDGCAGAAFHGLIRTAYAVQAAHRAELADALAHWCCSWQGLPVADGASPPVDADPAAVLRRLPLPRGPLAGRLIAQRVAVVAAQPGFAEAVAGLRIDERTLPRLARGAAVMYAASGNFTVLHLLTSAHALRVLLPFVTEPLPAVAAYWRAFAAAWAASGARDRGPAPLRRWDAIVAHAIASDDDHVAKLVHSCREQQAAYGGAVWRQAASRALQALP